MLNHFAIIIGAMKSGTTSLFYYLSEHPQILSCKEKEPHFFAYDHLYAKGMSWYRSLWDANTEPNKVPLEASTTYTMHPKYPIVVERMAETGADFKFIYILRHPYARIESHIRHLLSEGILKTPEIIDEHIEFTEYARQLDRFVEQFGRDRIHLMLLEDLNREPQAALRDICQFLQIDPDYAFQRVNVVRNSKETLNMHPLLRTIYKSSLVKSLAGLVPPELRQKLYKPFSRKDPFEVRLSDSDKAIVLNRLKPDLKRLQAEYGVDVKGKWGLDLSDSQS